MGSFSWHFEAVPLGSGLLSCTLEILGSPKVLGVLHWIPSICLDKVEEGGGDEKGEQEKREIL